MNSAVSSKTSENVYAKIKIDGTRLYNYPQDTTKFLELGNEREKGEKLLLISPTNCKNCHQNGSYHVRIIETGKEGWIYGDEIGFEN